MGLAALALVVGAAFAHAGWNLAAKRAGNGGAALVFLTAVVSNLLWAPVAAVLVLVTRPEVAGWTTTAVLAVSALFHGAYALLLQRGYAVGDLSVVYPVARGAGPALSVVVAILVLRERPGWLGFLGAAAVVSGILVVGSGRSTAAGLPAETGLATSPGPARHVLLGAGYGLAAGALIACYTIWDAWAMRTFSISPIVYSWGNGLGMTLVVAPYALTRWDRVRTVWREHRRGVLVIAVLSPLAYLLVLIAFTLAPVSLVAPARELSIVIGSVFGWLVLHEAQPVRRLTGAGVVLGGVLALAAA